jgi:hypothetical protein
VGDFQQALTEVDQLRAGVLIVECPTGSDCERDMAAQPGVGNVDEAVKFEVRKASSTEYVIALSTKVAGWFFIADANFPGWTAELNEQRVPLYSAQLLGKAVWVPQGEQELRVFFMPRSFYVGAAVSVFTGLLILLVLLMRRRSAYSTQGAFEGGVS